MPYGYNRRDTKKKSLCHRGRLKSRKDVPDYIRRREVGPAENMSTKSTQAELQEQEELQLMNNVNESQLFGSEGNTANMHEK